jgi:peptidoglycan/xylan/chitin deacetylase (PgdA/CDA1 family)
MYHAFARPDETPSRWIVSRRRFAWQMAWLHYMGYRVISLEDLVRRRLTGGVPPARSVVITIDDGYADVRSVAYPVLRRRGFPATIFVVTGKAGTCNDWSEAGAQLHGRALLSWPEVRELRDGGMQFGSHTRTHARLTAVPLQQARQEVEGSRTDLERELGAPVRLLAYPYGEHDVRTQALAEEADFLGSCAVQGGLNILRTPPHALRRIEISGTDSLARFALKVWSGKRRVLARRSIRWVKA